MHYVDDHPVFNTTFPLSSIVFQKLVQNQLEGGSDLNLTTKQLTFYYTFQMQSVHSPNCTWKVWEFVLV